MSENVGVGRFPPEIVSVAKAMANPSRMAILAHLEAKGPARFTDLGDLTCLESGALSPHLKKLQQGGLVQKVAFEQEGQVAERYQLSSFGRRLLDQVYEAFVPSTRSTWDRYTITSGAREVSGGRTIEDTMELSLAGEDLQLEA